MPEYYLWNDADPLGGRQGPVIAPASRGAIKVFKALHPACLSAEYEWRVGALAEYQQACAQVKHPCSVNGHHPDLHQPALARARDCPYGRRYLGLSGVTQGNHMWETKEQAKQRVEGGGTEARIKALEAELQALKGVGSGR